ncbi:MAG: hypothetical protein CMO41_04530 [Verrucomicrobiales bacterium]|nr:hypothetical protein [Verrucomicrobiales bacterium]
MEEHPDYVKEPTVETVVLPHPDVPEPEPAAPPPTPKPEKVVPMQEKLAPILEQPKQPVPKQTQTCCPALPNLPAYALVDTSELFLGFLGSFAVGGLCALTYIYFSRRQVMCDA